MHPRIKEDFDYAIELLLKEEIRPEERTELLRLQACEEVEDRTIARVFMRAIPFECCPGGEESLYYGYEFWQHISALQRTAYQQHSLPSLVTFDEKSCPCYVCNSICLLGLEKGTEGEWERKYFFPEMGEDNIYNCRIVCGHCSDSMENKLPVVYAMSTLPITTESLATKENIYSILDALKVEARRLDLMKSDAPKSSSHNEI